MVAVYSHRTPSAFAQLASHSALHLAWWDGLLAFFTADSCWVGRRTAFSALATWPSANPGVSTA